MRSPQEIKHGYQASGFTAVGEGPFGMVHGNGENHAASPTSAMTHVAIQEALNGKAVDWMEKVTDEEYQ